MKNNTEEVVPINLEDFDIESSEGRVERLIATVQHKDNSTPDEAATKTSNILKGAQLKYYDVPSLEVGEMISAPDYGTYTSANFEGERRVDAESFNINIERTKERAIKELEAIGYSEEYMDKVPEIYRKKIREDVSEGWSFDEAVRDIQEEVGVKQDGLLGPKTLRAAKIQAKKDILDTLPPQEETNYNHYLHESEGTYTVNANFNYSDRTWTPYKSIETPKAGMSEFTLGGGHAITSKELEDNSVYGVPIRDPETGEWLPINEEQMEEIFEKDKKKALKKIENKYGDSFRRASPAIKFLLLTVGYRSGDISNWGYTAELMKDTPDLKKALRHLDDVYYTDGGTKYSYNTRNDREFEKLGISLTDEEKEEREKKQDNLGIN